MYTDPAGHAYIGVGSKGDGVVAVQEMLDKLGCNTGGADGIYGKNTKAAVIQYQKDHGLLARYRTGKLHLIHYSVHT